MPGLQMLAQVQCLRTWQGIMCAHKYIRMYVHGNVICMCVHRHISAYIYTIALCKYTGRCVDVYMMGT